MTDEELQEMIDRADSNRDAAVTMDDFYNIMTKKTGGPLFRAGRWLARAGSLRFQSESELWALRSEL